jgi:hypothetical protein
MKVWITKYALTSGIIVADGELCEGSRMIRVQRHENNYSYAHYVHGEGKNWHRSEAEALKRAEVMRHEKIAALKKQLTHLESLKIKVVKRKRAE